MKPYIIDDPRDIDVGIRPLVQVFNEEKDFCTWGSCAGHTDKPLFPQTYVGVAVRGLRGLKSLVKWLNAVNERFGEDVWIDCGLNWSREVGASTDLENVPEWISFEIRFSPFDGKPVDSLTLKALARVFRSQLKKRGHPRRSAGRARSKLKR